MNQSFASSILLITGLTCGLGFGQSLLAQVTLQTERVASGLTSPLYATAPAGDSERLFIVEQGSGGSANIKILNLATRTVNSTPFLTINNLSTGGEQGLLGLAFHPDYASNGRFFVNYTDSLGNTAIRQYNVSANPNVADAGSSATVMNISQPFANHNGGWLGFGPDSHLYIASGDGGSGNDPNNHAQSTTDGALLGKILRIDVNQDAFPADPNRNYGIPASNPFAGVTAGDDEIWAYGLRNPWRPSFDRDTGDLYIADVGQGAREEINFQLANTTTAVNYGWRPKEGSVDNPGVPDAIPAGVVDPIHEYFHSGAPNGGFSITGGYVYRGSDIAGLDGTYFFADYVSEQIWSFRYDNGVLSEFTNRTAELIPNIGSIDQISSFAEDGRGELYVIDLGGEVFALTAVPEPAETAVIAGLGLIGLALFRRHQMRRKNFAR